MGVVCAPPRSITAHVEVFGIFSVTNISSRFALQISINEFSNPLHHWLGWRGGRGCYTAWGCGRACNLVIRKGSGSRGDSTMVRNICLCFLAACSGAFFCE